MNIPCARAASSLSEACRGAARQTLLCALAMVCAPCAWADEAGAGLNAQLDVQAWPAMHPPIEHAARFDGGRSNEIDTRLWIGRAGSALALGLGASRIDGSAAGRLDGPRAGSGETSVIVGLRYQLASGSRLTLGSTAGTLSPTGSTMDQPELRLGLDLKPARSAKRFSRGTLFRMQLSGGTQVSLRLRSGGLRLVLRSEF